MVNGRGVNGDAYAVSDLTTVDQKLIDFYAQLARLEQQAVSGRHPRLLLPSSAIEEYLRKCAAKGVGQAEGWTAVSNASPLLQPAPSAPSVPQARQPASSSLPAPPSSLAAAQAAPNSDPAPVQKPNDVAKSQYASQRTAIEQSLAQAVGSRRGGRPAYDGAEFGHHSFENDEILSSVHALVKPISGFQPKIADTPSASSSFDENSYYSSKAGSWSSEDAEPASRAEVPSMSTANTVDTRNKSAVSNASAGFSIPQGRVSGLGPATPPSQAPVTESAQPPSQQPSRIPGLSYGAQTPVRARDPLEESYSPPSAPNLASKLALQPQQPVVIPPGNANAIAMAVASSVQQVAAEDAVKDQFALTSRTRDSESYSPPPVVFPPQSQIPSPVPPPEAVPPISNGAPSLSAANGNGQGAQKTPPTGQQLGKRKGKPKWTKEQRNARKDAQAVESSKAGSQSTANPRKRKRDAGKELTDNSRRPSGQDVYERLPSPEPYIKQEPVSPPPFRPSAANDAPRRVVLREDGRPEIEVLNRAASRNNNASDLREGVAEPSQPNLPGRAKDASLEPSALGASPQYNPRSRFAPSQDDLELRRAASMRYARQVEALPLHPAYYGPGQYDAFYQSPRQPTVSRPASQQVQYLDDEMPMVPSQARLPQPRAASYMPAEREYMPAEEHWPRMMPPPPKRRIIIDEDGVEYIAMPVRQNRVVSDQVFAPYDREAMEDRAWSRPATERRQVARPAPQVIELDDDDDDYRRMPPPAPTRLVSRKRPVFEAPEGLPPAAPPMPFEHRAGGRAASMQPALHARREELTPQRPASSRRVWQYEDDAFARSQYERAYSARPVPAPGFFAYGQRPELEYMSPAQPRY